MYESTWTQPKAARFDTKQVICTVLGGVLAMGLIFLVGIHIGKDADPDFAMAGEAMGIDAESEVAEASLPEVPVLDESEAEPTDYEFFALLDSPAPTRALPEMELALNPVLEERKNKRKEARKKARDARKKAEAEAAKAAAPSAEETATDKVNKPAEKTPPEPERAVAAAASPSPEREDARPSPGVGALATATPASVGARPDVTALSAAIAPVEERVAPKVEAKKTAREKKREVPEKKKSKAEKKRSGRFTVQVSAFQDEAVADALAAEFQARGYRVHVKREAIPGRGAWFRVRVGKYGNRDEAAKARAEIKSKAGYDGFVTSI